MALEKQMELFEEGGLMQEGGTTDPVSGNDVPVGSTKEEVRDDIPAQLSEGEFVMPADVVRYHGLDKMMALRQEAKMGLKKMEQMGMMGNSDEATLPDDIPFEIDDIEMEDDAQEFAVGGMPQPYGMTQTNYTGIQGYQPSMFQNLPTTGPAMPPPPPAPPAPPKAPTQAYTPTMQPPATLPTFGEMVIPTYVTYVNELGYELQIPVDKDGNPLIPVPAGYKKKTAAEEQPTTPETTPPPTTVTETDRGNDKSPQELAEEAARREQVNARKAAAKELGYTKQQSIGEAILSITPLGFLVGDPEVGTVMADGTIADGQGNSFDPITGKQVGYSGGILGNIAGGLGLRDTEAEKFGLPEGSPIPESSLAGLKSQMGEKSIQAALAGTDAASVAKSTEAGYQSPISNEMIDAAVKAGLGTREEIMANIEATRPGTARVATTLGQTGVTSAAKATPATVSEAATTAAKVSYDNLSASQKGMVDSVAPTTLNEQAANILGIEIDAKSKGRALTPAEQSTVKDAVTDDLMTTRDTRATVEALTTDELTFRDIERTVAAEKAAQARTLAEESRMQQGQLGAKTTAEGIRDLVAAAAKSSNRRERENIQDKITQEMTGRTGYNKQYEADIRAGKYDDAFNARDNFNRDITREIQKSEREEIAAARSEGRSANLGSRPAGPGEVSDSKGNVVRDGQGNSVKSSGFTSSSKGLALAAEREQRESDNSTDSRVICTELYRQGKLSRELYRMDVVYTARYLSPTVIKGYHYWAIPTVQKMRKSDKLTKFMLYFTLKRAEEIAHIVNPEKYTKSSIAGKIIKNVGEALCYGIGLFVNNSDYKSLYKGEETC